jgi:MOSC domain-containing protein YiiM
MNVVSVNIGRAEAIVGSSKPMRSGINKQPVDSAVIGELGLIDDAIVDTKHHGGTEQAVYLYSVEDYDFWTNELGGRTLVPGQFGENLTVDSFGPEELRVGDRFSIGEVELELTCPRIPCNTFSAHMGVDRWIQRFRDARRPGPYAKVNHGGVVKPGMELTRTLAPAGNPTILDLQDAYYGA